MSKLAVLAFLIVVPVALSRPASACVTDAECDNGDTCSVPDQCVTGSCVLGGGGDQDGNLVCDDEFDPAADIKVTKVVAKTSALAGRDLVRGGGDFIDLGSVGGAFTGDDGIAFRVKDQLSTVDPPGDGFDVTAVFPGSDCKTTPKGTTCVVSSGPLKSSNAKFRRNPLAPEQFRFSFKIKGLDLTKPFFGPVRVVMTHNTDVHRLGLVTDCKLFATGIKCREF
jgi:hypothetical protein